MNTPLSGAFLVYTRPFRGSGCAQRAAFARGRERFAWRTDGRHSPPILRVDSPATDSVTPT